MSTYLREMNPQVWWIVDVARPLSCLGELSSNTSTKELSISQSPHI
jgi:hypothetical protein